MHCLKEQHRHSPSKTGRDNDQCIETIKPTSFNTITIVTFSLDGNEFQERGELNTLDSRYLVPPEIAAIVHERIAAAKKIETRTVGMK